MSWINSIYSYLFWLCWSVIVGGMLLAGPLLAPLAFKTMPLTVPPEIAQHAHDYAGVLFTLFFVRYFPIVAGLFLLISILEQWQIRTAWQVQRNKTILLELLLLGGNVIWFWLALQIVPQMENMVMNVETWNEIAVRETFAKLHEKSQLLSEIGLGITLILPWVAGHSGLQTVSILK